MPLKGTEELLGKKLSEAMKSAPSFEDAWTIFAKVVLTHLTENAVATGVAPSGGGPITGGKIQ
ncbi:MAG: hypothetical protein EOP04_13065 [Proteobacteria bacterium]|nr:MAG: hypothetical protein EOP04_13065 [Pseudomonadota bacterium]